jgi:hypothetical protein
MGYLSIPNLVFTPSPTPLSGCAWASDLPLRASSEHIYPEGGVLARLGWAGAIIARCEHRGRMPTHTSSSLDSFALSLYAFGHHGRSR